MLQEAVGSCQKTTQNCRTLEEVMRKYLGTVISLELIRSLVLGKLSKLLEHSGSARNNIGGYG